MLKAMYEPIRTWLVGASTFNLAIRISFIVMSLVGVGCCVWAFYHPSFQNRLISQIVFGFSALLNLGFAVAYVWTYFKPVLPR